MRTVRRLLPAIPRPLQPLVQGLLAVPAFALVHGVVLHSGTRMAMPWGRFVIPFILIGVIRSEVTQRFIGGGRLDNRLVLRLVIANVLFFMALAPTGLVFLFPVTTALTAAVHVPWSGSRTWRRAAWLSAVLHLVVQLELAAGLLPRIMSMPASHLATAASFLLALVMMANTGALARQKEVADAALAAEQERRTDDLVWAANHDGLTGLLNRSGLEPALQAARAGAAPGAGIGVVFMDLDGFKAVNDGQGHAAGDELLQAVAQRLSGALRSGDVLARIGGDEFVALLTALPTQAPLHELSQRAQAAIDEPFDLTASRARISVSVGSAFTDQPDCSLDVLVRAADTAMYEQKRTRHQGSARTPARLSR